MSTTVTIDVSSSIPSHANILKYNGWCQHESKIYLVTEFMEGGSLDEYIVNDQVHYTLHEILKILSGLAAGKFDATTGIKTMLSVF